VIRGPGASVWGANAVNRIINIITKNTEDTQGGLVSLTAGDEESVIAGVRHGGPLGEQGYYGIYGKHFERDGLVDESGRDAGDEWDLTRGGFRADWAPSQSDTLMAQGDVYNSNSEQNFAVPSLSSPTGGRRARCRWQRKRRWPARPRGPHLQQGMHRIPLNKPRVPLKRVRQYPTWLHSILPQMP